MAYCHSGFVDPSCFPGMAARPGFSLCLSDLSVLVPTPPPIPRGGIIIRQNQAFSVGGCKIFGKQRGASTSCAKYSANKGVPNTFSFGGCNIGS